MKHNLIIILHETPYFFLQVDPTKPRKPQWSNTINTATSPEPRRYCRNSFLSFQNNLKGSTQSSQKPSRQAKCGRCSTSVRETAKYILECKRRHFIRSITLSHWSNSNSFNDRYQKLPSFSACTHTAELLRGYFYLLIKRPQTPSLPAVDQSFNFFQMCTFENDTFDCVNKLWDDSRQGNVPDGTIYFSSSKVMQCSMPQFRVPQYNHAGKYRMRWLKSVYSWACAALRMSPKSSWPSTSTNLLAGWCGN